MEVEESDEESVRTMEKVENIANIAGLSRRTGMVQTLSFSSDLGDSEFKLLELSKDVLGSMKEGESVVIRGDGSDEAVLCTETGSYEVKAADTSNLLILLPELKTPKSSDFDKERTLQNVEIVESLFSYYELKKIRPKLQRLRYLLEQTQYTGPENEEQNNGKTLSFDDLKNMVQASETEIQHGLENIGAFQLRGCWRLLGVSYKEKVFAQILKLLDEESWNYWEIPLKTTCEILEELYPREIIEHCLHLYGKRAENDAVQFWSGGSICEIDRVGQVNGSGELYLHLYEKRAENDDHAGDVFSLEEDKVCQFFAECILRGAEKFNHHEFFEAWKESVPDGMITKIEQLKGIALEDTASLPPVIWYFPASNLPEDPAERFNTLFRVRSRWTRLDIEPYISELCGPKSSMDALLLKHARCSTDAIGNKVYNSKRPVQ